MFGILTRIIKIVFWLQLYNIVMLIIVPIRCHSISTLYADGEVCAHHGAYKQQRATKLLTQLSRIYFSNIYNYIDSREIMGAACVVLLNEKAQIGSTHTCRDWDRLPGRNARVHVIVSPNCNRRQSRCEFFVYANVFIHFFCPLASRSRKAQHTKPFI